MSAPELIVTVQDLYTVPAWNGEAGYCARGARAWCERHGIEWAGFVREGLPASVLAATGDALALHLIEHARQRAEAGRGW